MSQEKKTHFEYYIEDLLPLTNQLSKDDKRLLSSTLVEEKRLLDSIIASSHYTAPEMLPTRGYEALCVLANHIVGKEKEAFRLYRRYFPWPDR